MRSSYSAPRRIVVHRPPLFPAPPHTPDETHCVDSNESRSAFVPCAGHKRWRVPDIRDYFGGSSGAKRQRHTLPPISTIMAPLPPLRFVVPFWCIAPSRTGEEGMLALAEAAAVREPLRVGDEKKDRHIRI